MPFQLRLWSYSLLVHFVEGTQIRLNLRQRESILWFFLSFFHVFSKFVIRSFSIVSNSGFFCYHFRIVANWTWIQAQTLVVKGIFSLHIEIRIICHHVSFWTREWVLRNIRFKPYCLFGFLDPFHCSFLAVNRSNRFIVIILFNKICKLPSCFFEPMFWIF